jgi:hypothetical protein
LHPAQSASAAYFVTAQSGTDFALIPQTPVRMRVSAG